RSRDRVGGFRRVLVLLGRQRRGRQQQPTQDPYHALHLPPCLASSASSAFSSIKRSRSVIETIPTGRPSSSTSARCSPVRAKNSSSSSRLDPGARPKVS